jgi:hypothetical protein
MNHLKRKWNSLWDVKEYFMKTKVEIVEYYDGGVLRTNKGEYGLAFGELKFRKKDEA